MEVKTVGIACDHAGFPLKQFVLEYLEKKGYPVKDYGTYSDASVDYPDFGHALAKGIESGEVYPGIGICGSGSFAVSAAKIDPRLKAVATVSMYDMGSAARNGLKKALMPEQRKQILSEAAEQRYVEFQGGEVKYTGGTMHERPDASNPIQQEFYDFYRTERGEYTPKGASPETTTHPTLTSNVKFMNFYPFNDIETISPRALLFITGDTAHSREFSEDAYVRA